MAQIGGRPSTWDPGTHDLCSYAQFSTRTMETVLSQETQGQRAEKPNPLLKNLSPERHMWLPLTAKAVRILSSSVFRGKGNTSNKKLATVSYRQPTGKIHTFNNPYFIVLYLYLYYIVSYIYCIRVCVSQITGLQWPSGFQHLTLATDKHSGDSEMVPDCKTEVQSDSDTLLMIQTQR